jgi:signal recognition particle subunit SRP54
VFQTLSERLQGVFRALRGRGTLSTQDIEHALREVRLALLEADVHFQVVKELLSRVRERALNQEIFRSLTPDQAVLRIVRDEMIAVLGGDVAPRLLSSSRLPSVILLVGLQGSGRSESPSSQSRFCIRGATDAAGASTLGRGRVACRGPRLPPRRHGWPPSHR